MENITITSASGKDQNQLINFFHHYGVEDIIQSRIECYLNHNFTIVAKDKNKIIGVLQWHIKENPSVGVAEFEEIYVSENYRNQKIGSLLVDYAIESVKNYFRKINIRPRKIFLFVSENNKNARGLYEKHNFKLISEIGSLFAESEMELFYCLDLN